MKVSTASVCSAFRMVKKNIIIFPNNANHYTHKSLSDLKQPTGDSVFWLQWSVFES